MPATCTHDHCVLVGARKATASFILVLSLALGVAAGDGDLLDGGVTLRVRLVDAEVESESLRRAVDELYLTVAPDIAVVERAGAAE